MEERPDSYKYQVVPFLQEKNIDLVKHYDKVLAKMTSYFQKINISCRNYSKRSVSTKIWILPILKQEDTG